MITRATTFRLLVFVVLTLVGLAYVGARYAEVDRLFVDERYDVTVNLAESGGIFVGADVTYRGVSVGRVSDLELSGEGVDATVAIEEDYDEIPEDLQAVVANKSAVGEQYIDLQPRADDGPYLADGSVIDQPDTETPISTKTLLTDLSAFVGSVNTKDLRTVIHELGVGFEGTGEDLTTIIDTSNSFIRTANNRFGVTARLIRDGATVLKGQLASASSIRSFSRDLAAFSDSLRRSDADLRTVLDDAPATVKQLGALLSENEKKLGKLLDNLTQVNRVVRSRLPGLRGVFVLAPYAVENGYSILSKNRRTGKYEIRLSMALDTNPSYCQKGYPQPQDLPNPKQLNGGPLKNRKCQEPASKTNVRGVQNADALNGSSVLGVYDPETEEFDPGAPDDLARAGIADDTPSEDSWTRLMTAPTTR